MKTHRIVCFSFILAGLTPLAAAEVRISDLTVESLPSPVGVDSTAPRFSWNYQGDARDFHQKARRITVASSAQKLDTPDLWDSGWIEQPDTLNISYAGAPLQSEQTCHWQVQTRDTLGAVHLSAPATFEMGLLHPADWASAKWIARQIEAPPTAAVRMESWTDYTIDTRFRILETCANLHFRSSYIGNKGYFLQLEPGAKDNLSIYRTAGNQTTRLQGFSSPAPLAPGTWHTLRVSAKGGRFEIRIDDVPAGSFEDATYPSGTAGVGALRHDGSSGHTSFDDFTISSGAGPLFHEDFESPALNNFQDLLFVGGGRSQPRDGSLDVRGVRSLVEDKRHLESPLFRRAFAVSKPVRRARAYVCGIGYHEMSINGRKIGDRFLEPGYSRYDKRVYYSIYDLTDSLKADNVVGFELGRGWFGIRTPSLWGEYADPSWVAEPKLMACIKIEFTDGTTENIVTDSNFRTAPGPILFDSIKAGEVHDARKNLPGWNEPGFDDRAWIPATMATPPLSKNIALHRPLTASSSLSDWGWDIKCATDGDRRSTRASMGWHSHPEKISDDVKWLSMDLGEVSDVLRLRIQPRSDRQTGFFPRDFDVQSSSTGGTSESEWQTIHETRGLEDTTASISITPASPLRTRFLRIKGLHMTGTNFAIAEWEVYGSKAPLPQSQMFPPIRVIERLPALSVKPLADGAYAVDFGKHIAGNAELKLQGSRGDRVLLQYAEKWDEKGTPLMQPFDSATTGCYQQDAFILAGGGPEVFEAKFSYKGFRYLIVHGFPGTPKPENFTALVMHTDMRSTGSFECSSPLLNAISDASFASIRSNMHSIPTDCPTFEKLGWSCDDAAPLEAMMYGYDVESLYQKRMTDYADDIRADGSISDVVPSTWGRVGSDPAWNGSLISIAWKIHCYYGSDRILADHYDEMKRYFTWLTRQANQPGKPSHIVYPDNRRGYGDWVPPDHRGGHGPESHSLYQTCYYYWYATLMERIAAALGRHDDTAAYQKQAVAIRTAINARFFDASAGAYFSPGRAGGFRQASQVVPLAFGIVPDGMEPQVFNHLVEDIRKRDGHFWVGILGFEFIADVLMDHGHHRMAMDGHLKTDFPSLGNMIREGATTLWESYSLSTTRSLNHKMFSTISEWMFRDLAGLGNDPTHPGFTRAIIAPRPSPPTLSHAKATYDSKSGRYESGWRVENDRWFLQIAIPPNAGAEAILPVEITPDLSVREGTRSFWENGKPQDGAAISSSIHPSPRGLHLTLPSGRYEFSCPLSQLTPDTPR